MTEKYKVEIKGMRPLLMNSCKAMIAEKENKPMRNRKEMSLKEEAERVLYTDKSGKPVVPSYCILSCLRKSAVNFKVPGRGKKTYKDFIYSGVQITPEDVPIISESSWEIDLRPCVIGAARVIKAKPKFMKWGLKFEVEILDPIITPSAFKEILVDAGKYNGLLEFRPLFGLFSVEIFEKVKNE